MNDNLSSFSLAELFQTECDTQCRALSDVYIWQLLLSF